MTDRRAAVLAPLVCPSARLLRWAPLGAIVVIGGWIVWTGGRDAHDPSRVALPIATTMLGLWLCFAFEDAAAEIDAPAPSPLWLRRALRSAIAIAPVVAAWFAFTWIGPLDGPTVPMVEMVVAVVAIALACAAVATRLVAPDRSGLAAGAGLVAIVLVLPLTLAAVLRRGGSIDPSQVVLGDPLAYWSTMTAAALVVLVVVHRDPATHGFRRARRPTHRAAAPAHARGTP